MSAAPEGSEFLHYSYPNFMAAKSFVFRMWCELALERQIEAPTDLSGACKYGSMFMQRVFGGEIEGHYQHQFNRIQGRLVDLSHDALDVGLMRTPYLHEPDFFLIPHVQSQQLSCLPRVENWSTRFLAELAPYLQIDL